MAMMDWTRSVAAVGLVMAVGLGVEADARGQAASSGRPAPVVPRVGVGPTVPGVGVGPTLPNVVPQGANLFAPFGASSGAVFGGGGYVYGDPLSSNFGYGGLGYGGLGYGGFGNGGFGYGGLGGGGLYGNFGGTYGGPGVSLPPTPEFGAGAYRAGNSFPGQADGPGLGAGRPADPNASRAGNARRKAMGRASEDPFDSAPSADQPSGRGDTPRRASAHHRMTGRKPAHRPTRKPEARSPEARPGVDPMRDRAPAASRDEPAPVTPEPAKPAARKRSALGPPE